jgi:hypothetical protein
MNAHWPDSPQPSDALPPLEQKIAERWIKSSKPALGSSERKWTGRWNPSEGRGAVMFRVNHDSYRT